MTTVNFYSKTQVDEKIASLPVPGITVRTFNTLGDLINAIPTQAGTPAPIVYSVTILGQLPIPTHVEIIKSGTSTAELRLMSIRHNNASDIFIRSGSVYLTDMTLTTITLTSYYTRINGTTISSGSETVNIEVSSIGLLINQ